LGTTPAKTPDLGGFGRGAFAVQVFEAKANEVAAEAWSPGLSGSVGVCSEVHASIASARLAARTVVDRIGISLLPLRERPRAGG
jgi:hypothetical protein